MKETGIIMSGDHPRLVLEGAKTQTRRTAGLWKVNENPDDWGLVAYFQDGLARFYNKETEEDITLKCPYGQVGDLLYIKETHYKYGKWQEIGVTKTHRIKFAFEPMVPYERAVRYLDDPGLDRLIIHKGIDKGVGWYKRPAIFMLKKDARILLEIIAEPLPERVQDISEESAKLEGVSCHWTEGDSGWGEIKKITKAKSWAKSIGSTHRLGFRVLWDSLNAKRGHGWDKNDWVWPINFKLIER